MCELKTYVALLNCDFCRDAQIYTGKNIDEAGSDEEHWVDANPAIFLGLYTSSDTQALTAQIAEKEDVITEAITLLPVEWTH